MGENMNYCNETHLASTQKVYCYSITLGKLIYWLRCLELHYLLFPNDDFEFMMCLVSKLYKHMY